MWPGNKNLAKRNALWPGDALRGVAGGESGEELKLQIGYGSLSASASEIRVSTAETCE